MSGLEMLALISFQERLLCFCPFTHYLHIFFLESGESGVESEDTLASWNKMSFLTLMTPRILLVIWMVLIWTGSMKTNHSSQKRKTLKIPSQETLLGESENINDNKKRR